MDENERVKADDGYAGDDSQLIKVSNWYHANDFEKAASNIARNHHETGHNLMKKFGILKKRFEYSLKKHSMCFRVCDVLTQLSIDLGDMRMFDIADTYDDLYWLRLNLGGGTDEQDDSDNDL